MTLIIFSSGMLGLFLLFLGCFLSSIHCCFRDTLLSCSILSLSQSCLSSLNYYFLCFPHLHLLLFLFWFCLFLLSLHILNLFHFILYHWDLGNRSLWLLLFFLNLRCFLFLLHFLIISLLCLFSLLICFLFSSLLSFIVLPLIG